MSENDSLHKQIMDDMDFAKSVKTILNSNKPYEEYVKNLEHDHKVMREAQEKYGNQKVWLAVVGTDGILHAILSIPEEEPGDTARTALSSLLVKDSE